MFALNATEILLVTLWVLGVAAAIYAVPLVTEIRQRIGLLLAAFAVPILGSVIVIAVAVAKWHQGRARRMKELDLGDNVA